jgi:hypothetical protein
MEKYPQGLPSHFFREPKPKKEKKKKKKRKLVDLEPASVKKQLKLAGPINVSTRSKRGDSVSETLSSGDLTSFNSGEGGSYSKNENSNISLTETEKSSQV